MRTASLNIWVFVCGHGGIWCAISAEHVKNANGTATENRYGCKHLECVLRPDVVLADRKFKLQVIGQAKGGATVTTQILFNFLNITDKALAYHAWIHRYRLQVFDRLEEHRSTECQECGQKGWTCVMVVRNPLDRVVSSYIHVMKSKKRLFIRKVKPDFGNNVSFAGFIEWLKLVANGTKKTAGSGHYMPQCWSGCGNVGNALKYIPTECLDAGLVWFGKTEHVQGLSRRNMSSGHYIAKSSVSSPRAAHLPYNQELHASHSSPSLEY